MEHDLGVIDKKLEQKRRSEPLGLNKQKMVQRWWIKNGGAKNCVEQKSGRKIAQGAKLVEQKNGVEQKYESKIRSRSKNG